jgi:hypothetical protein
MEKESCAHPACDVRWQKHRVSTAPDKASAASSVKMQSMVPVVVNAVTPIMSERQG